MAAKPEDVIRVSEFRNRLVAFGNLVARNSGRQPTPQHVIDQIGHEQTWLSQEYGRITPVIGRFGKAAMQQYGMIASQDVVRDAIQSPSHPGYGDVVQMAVGHLDMIIGQLRAEVEDQAAKRLSLDDWYRLTSPLFWLRQLFVFWRWVLSTNRGRIAAGISVVVLAIIGAIIGSAADAWFGGILSGPPPTP